MQENLTNYESEKVQVEVISKILIFSSEFLQIAYNCVQYKTRGGGDFVLFMVRGRAIF